jgi:hypothetical protein
VNAYAVAVADVNGDGKLDLLVANFCAPGTTTCGQGISSGAVSVLLGNGDGIFQVASAFSSGGYGAESVAVADVNGDGKLDLLVTNACISSFDCGSGTVGVLLGKGDGTFQTALTFTSGAYNAVSVAVADMNGDGKPDLAVANESASSTVSVLINTSSFPYKAFVQPPIDTDGSSIFKANRGVIPVRFTLTQNALPTCTLPPATIAVIRTAGRTPGPVDAIVYTTNSDDGSKFRVDGCQYSYGLGSASLGEGTYSVDINVLGNAIGHAEFALQ